MLAGTEQLAADRALKCLHQLDASTGIWKRISELAAAEPHRVAVVTGTETMTYQGLCHRVRQIQATLLVERCEPGDRIAVVGPRSADTIAVFLAIESLGAVYLPVASEWPVARVAGMFEHSQPRCVILIDITRGHCSTVVQAAAEAFIPVVAVPGENAEVAAWTAPRIALDDEARYIIQTSGTAGRPKGAVVNQMGLLNHLWSMVAALGLTDSDTVAFTAPPVYVISIWQMLAALLVGGSVVVVADNDMRFARHLVASAVQARVTVMELVPTVIRWIVQDAKRRKSILDLPDLRCLISTGERLDLGLAAEVLQAFPQKKFFNAYGSTECSDDVSLHLITARDLTAPQLPAGKPLPNVALYLLVNENGVWRAAEAGEAGDLWVGGVAVGAGYLGEPDVTREAFFVDDFDPHSPTGRLYRTGDLATFENGLVRIIGRVDRRVKIAGMRIELAEIETAMSRIPGVLQCVAVAERPGDDTQISVYYTAESGILQDDLLAHLRSSLPKEMFPRQWVRLETMPRNGSGKIDYRALLKYDTPDRADT
ncbi:AMP-binding protein [Streptomyces scopuliridis]|uniref:AMP-binding protein n=1 Tax=Streptomyces scopuliridis TaxID=452529 RepID=UPI0036B69A23